MAERDEFGAFLIGFIVGGLTGAAISLIMAPQSGEDTRGYLKDQAIVLKDKAQETALSARDQLDSATSEVRTRATDLAGKARTSAEDLTSKARTSAEELRQRGQVVLEEQRARLQGLRSGHTGEEETPI